MNYKTDHENEFTGERGGAFAESANYQHDLSADEELKARLERWEAPASPRSLDLRVMAAYRKQHSAPFWRRALDSSIRVPVPIAAAVILLFFASGFLALRAAQAPTPQEVSYQATPEVKVIEVPVVQERVVTRTVYVEKKRDRKAQPSKQARSRYIAEIRNNDEPAARDEGESGRFFTRANLSGFQPVEQMRIEIIRRTRTNED